VSTSGLNTPVESAPIELAEMCSIGVVVRDRVSLVPTCLESLGERGLGRLTIIAVVGGAPPRFRADWPKRFPSVRFVFSDEHLTAGQSRNRVLELVETPLVALLDADVTGEPKWLERCCDRLRMTGAAIVVPVVVYPEGMIHAAGNMEYPNHVDGVTYLHKEHRFYGMPYAAKCDLPAVEVDYAESHCFVADVDALQTAGRFDEELIEFGEVDTGRRVRAIGRSVWVEPAAVVHSDQDSLIELEDVEVFESRWDPKAIDRSRQRFMDVWKVDVGEQGGFAEFVSIYNSRLGLLPRRHLRPWTVVLDRKVHGLAINVRKITRRLSRLLRPIFGVS
jgi:GT2 family glycosyltransferase